MSHPDSTPRFDTDLDLVRRAQQGDSDAFASLFYAHKARIYSVCLRMTNNTAEAEDLTQETFMAAVRWIKGGGRVDALERDESCGCHFRTEHQMADGEAKRNDEKFSYVAAWEFGADRGDTSLSPVLHKEHLVYTAIEMKQRSYK